MKELKSSSSAISGRAALMELEVGPTVMTGGPVVDARRFWQATRLTPLIMSTNDLRGALCSLRSWPCHGGRCPAADPRLPWSMRFSLRNDDFRGLELRQA